jgi:diguanylate cyclase (GGDEF)-like protein
MLPGPLFFPRQAATEFLRPLAFVFAVILAASLFGILTRPMGFLAAVWPANAVLLALMVRKPSLSTPLGWLAAFLGYLTADLITGGGLVVTLWLTAANMAGALVGYLLFMRLPEEDRRLQRPISIVSMFWICTMAAGTAGLVGGGAAKMLFDRDIVAGFSFWFTTELVNALIVVPVILTAPPLREVLYTTWFRRPRSRHIWPVLALFASTAAGIAIDSPGVIAYPTPALIWCALTFSLFVTSLMTLGFSVSLLIATSAGILPLLSVNNELLIIVSTRLAIAMTALGPLAVASINENREKLVERLQYLATHDGLTGVLSRGAFLTGAADALLDCRKRGQSYSALMIDVDHFKRINDTHGHAAGDAVLVMIARALKTNLRTGDLIGRLGGEEFAVFCPGLSENKANQIAERLRVAVEELKLEVEGVSLHTTVSIGIVFSSKTGDASLGTLLVEADKSLYTAKAEGRNRVVAVSINEPLRKTLESAVA